MVRTMLFVLAAAALAQRPWPPPGLRCPERTLVLYEVQPSNASRMSGLFDEHTAYLVEHMKAGRIVAAGKTEKGGAAIFSSKDWLEVEGIINKDPYVREHIAAVASHTVWNACEAEK